MTEQKRQRVLYSFRCLFLNHIALVLNRRPFKLHLILVFKGVAVTLAYVIWLPSAAQLLKG